VLYYFYQDDYFTALTRLLAAEIKDRVRHHADDAELLLGGLYLSVGQHREAGAIFAAVLDRPKVPQAVRDRARFFLGKVWYQRGYFDEAAKTLALAGRAGLTPEMETERRMLLGQALLFLGRYDEAVAALSRPEGTPTWRAYADYNRGVALVRSGHLDDGIRALDAVGTLPGGSAERDALRDKANLALGYAYLQANRSAEARTTLERVRLEGPLSTKALLGVGWAESSLGLYQEALAPWLELHGRGLLDSAVQESYLAVPYAYSKLGADREATAAYETAIREFGAEAERLQQSIAAIRQGGLVDAVLSHESSGRQGWTWQLTSVPDAPLSRYLYHLMARNDFQEGLKNYRMLRYLGKQLDDWAPSIDSFDDMLAARKLRYSQEMPAALTRIQAVDPDQLRRRLTTDESQLATAVANGDRVALASARERETWQQIEHMEAILATAGDDPELAETRDKLRLIKGVLYWQMNAAFKARTWGTQRALREIAQGLHETEHRWALVQDARAVEPDHDGAFAARIAILRPRIETAREHLAKLEAAEERYLGDIAVHELESQQERIGTYLLQARYALATIYDRAGAGRPAPPEDKP
jgi:tetratricopeptide (TPR) repeat protein